MREPDTLKVDSKEDLVIREEGQIISVTPASLLAMAVQQGADLKKLEKLMDLQERWEATEAKKAYVAATSSFRAACPIIDSTRKGYSSKYAGLAETIEQIKGILGEHGLSHSWKTTQKDSLIEVTCCLTHIGGHSECTSLNAAADNTGNKNSIQAIGSTVSYLERYTLFALLGLASKDMDDDGKTADSIPVITEDQANEIHAKIAEHGVPMDKFMVWLRTDLKCNSIEEITVNAYKIVHERIDQAIRAQKKGKA